MFQQFGSFRFYNNDPSGIVFFQKGKRGRAFRLLLSGVLDMTFKIDETRSGKTLKQKKVEIVINKTETNCVKYDFIV